jgi:peptidoglycan/xylan/chitin deacetylase (PgdA/CDA1 family)
MAQRYPDLVRQEVAAGHEIGNHTFSHANVARLTENGAAAEWEAGDEAITAITGEKVRYCRPPGGRYDRDSVIAASELGLTMVLWTDNSADYLGMSPHRLEQRVLSRISNGGIVLMHDGVQQTIDVLPDIIEKLRSKGYRFVTLSELEDQRNSR